MCKRCVKIMKAQQKECMTETLVNDCEKSSIMGVQVLFSATVNFFLFLYTDVGHIADDVELRLVVQRI